MGSEMCIRDRDDQVGEIVRRAQSVEVHTPTQDFLYQALKAREEIARSGE